MADKIVEQYKQQAAQYAVTFIESGMRVGLGHGSTAYFALQQLATLLKEGSLRNVRGIPCSRQVEQDAMTLGIPLLSSNELFNIDITIDGADEITPELFAIKGGGGALLREKIVAQASRREIIIVDESKLSDCLGRRSALPVEVLPFGWQEQARFLTELGARVTQRLTPSRLPVVTDQGNVILDCDFGAIPDPPALAATLQNRAGILAHGLFIGLVSEVVIAGASGIRVLVRE